MKAHKYMTNKNLTIFSLGLAAISTCLSLVLLILFLNQKPQAKTKLSLQELVITDENGHPQILLSAHSQNGSQILLGNKESQHLYIQNTPKKSGLVIQDQRQVKRVALAYQQSDKTTSEQVHFNIYNNQKKQVAQILNDAGQTKLGLFNNIDSQKVVLGSSAKSTGMLVSDEKNQTRMGLYYNNQHSHILLYDKRGVRRMAFSLLKHKPQFALLDSRQRPRASLLLHNDQPSFEFYDRKGKIRYKLMESNEDTIMAFLDPKTNPLVTLGLSNQKPQIQMLNGKQKLLWSISPNNIVN